MSDEKTGGDVVSKRQLIKPIVLGCFLLFGYGIAVAAFNSAESTQFASWLTFTKPITDFINSLIPGATYRLSQIGASEYADRVLVSGHIFAGAFISALVLGLWGAPYYTGRKAPRPIRYAMNSKTLNGLLASMFGGGGIYGLNVGRNIAPENFVSKEYLIAGYLNNGALVWEYVFYECCFLLTVMGLVLLIDGLVVSLRGKGNNLNGSS